MDLKDGSVFAGRYTIEGVVGAGAFARVYKAKQNDLGRTVAIKVLHTRDSHPERLEEARRRFEREVKVVSRLNEPHTLTIYDFGATEDGGMFMVSEFVEGTTLKEWAEKNPKPSWQMVLQIIRQILFSLAEAHSHGVIHRDIKPANIMVFDLPGRARQVKVLDFGIARAFDEASGEDIGVSVTRRGRTVGTPGYMAPEQLRGEDVGPPADLYAVGIIAYELFKGESAFKTMNEFEAAALQLNEDNLSLGASDDIPEMLKNVVNQMLKKQPSGRPRDATQVLELLSQLELREISAESSKRAKMLWSVVVVLAIAAFAAFSMILF